MSDSRQWLRNTCPPNANMLLSGVFATLALSLTACSDRADHLGPNTEPPSGSDRVLPQGTRTNEFPAVRRISPSITAQGPFRPRHRIRLQVGVRANLPVTSNIVQVWSLDEEPGVEPTGHGPRRLSHSSAGLPLGSVRRLDPVLTFDRPGYYRVVVRAESKGPLLAKADTAVLDNNYELLWILVDEKGGRLTPGFDSTVIDSDHRPLYGSYGPFLPARPAPPESRSSVGNQVAGAPTTGRVRYLNASMVLTGVPDVLITARCFTGSPADQYVQVKTDGSGNFSFTCQTATFTANAVFVNNFLEASGKNGAFSGALFSGNTGTFWDLRAANDFAAHTYIVLSRQIPDANTRFGRSRPRITVRVADADPNYGIYYSSGDDRIATNYTRVFGEDGEFVSTHEFGHAFHYKAIEAPGPHDCTDGRHSINVPDLMGCAFVEGFADFFSIWVAGERLTTSWSPAFASDNALESNPWRSLGDGSRIEGAVAAFLYDLVDAPGSPDSPSNSSDGDESFDGVSFSGSYVADLIKTCSLSNPGDFAVSKLDGIDQFIYCAERSVTATPLGVNWRSYTSFTEGATEPSFWSLAVIRRLWRYNLYNVQP